jgi:hypothetical protein
METVIMRIRKSLTLAALGLGLASTLSGCGGGSSSPGAQQAPTSTVNLVVTDTPSSNITVLSFQLQITAAVLQPGNVAILPRPVTVDLAQLVSDTGLLASTVIDSATYTSLEITYANPQATILNNGATPITLAGQSCAPGATCTFTPSLNNATVTISNGVFPLTLTANSSSGLSLDLSIPDLLQSDLSVTFANGSSVNLSLLGDAPINVVDVLGTVTSINGNEIGITTSFGNSLVVESSGSSLFTYPSSACTSSGISCVSKGQLVAIDFSLGGNGTLTLDSLDYIGASGTSWVKAIVLSTTMTPTPSAQLLLLRGLNTPSLNPGEVATVPLAADASYLLGSVAAPVPANVSFSSFQDLVPGQELVVSVGSDLVAGTAPMFTSAALYLESSQIIGQVVSVDGADSSLTLDGLSGLFAAARPVIQEIDVHSGDATDLVGIASLSNINPGQLIVAKGPLFNSQNSIPLLDAKEIGARTAQ